MCYRALNRTSQEVFKGDHEMLEASKRKIKKEFTQNKAEKDPERIEELLKTAEEAEEVLRRLIVQGVRKPDGIYSLIFTENTAMEDNATMPKW